MKKLTKLQVQLVVLVIAFLFGMGLVVLKANSQKEMKLDIANAATCVTTESSFISLEDVDYTTKNNKDLKIRIQQVFIKEGILNTGKTGLSYIHIIGYDKEAIPQKVTNLPEHYKRIVCPTSL